jgi:hypothetical protein
MGSASALAAVGGICGAVFTDVVQAKLAHATSLEYLNLLGVVVGAALPQLVGGRGAYWRLRATAGVVITVLAAVIGFGGLTAAARVPALKDVTPQLPGTAQEFELQQEKAHRGGEPDITIRPEGTLTCTTAGCPEEVTIVSTGTAPLAIDDIEFNGPDAGDFGQTGECENIRLAPGEECSLRVRFEPSGTGSTRRAELVVNQNLRGPPSYLRLEGAVSGVDLMPATQDAKCSYARRGGQDLLRVQFRLVHEGAGRTEPKVAVTARSDTGSVEEYSAASGPTFFAIPIVLNQKNTIVVHVDPNDEFTERDEANNRMRVTVTLPEKITSSPFKCRFDPLGQR